MAVNKAFMNLSGAMDLIKMSKNPLTPVYEAITNSLESLAMKFEREVSDQTDPEIEVKFYFTGLLEEYKDLEQVEIVDNGIGFTDENYNRFIEFFDKSKGYDNRGTGRLQYFHRFNKIHVESTFLIDGDVNRRVIKCDKKNFISSEELTTENASSSPSTKIVLSDYSSDQSERDFFSGLTADEIETSIKSHFLLRFYLDIQKDAFHPPKVKITLMKGKDKLDERVIEPDSLPKPQEQGEIKVPYMRLADDGKGKAELETVAGRHEVIKWAHFMVTF